MDCLDETIQESGNKWEREQHEGMEACIERMHRQDQCMHEQKEVELSAHWCVSCILVYNIPYNIFSLTIVAMRMRMSHHQSIIQSIHLVSCGATGTQQTRSSVQ